MPLCGNSEMEIRLHKEVTNQDICTLFRLKLDARPSPSTLSASLHDVGLSPASKHIASAGST